MYIKHHLQNLFIWLYSKTPYLRFEFSLMKNIILCFFVLFYAMFVKAQTCTDFPNIAKSIAENAKICPEAMVNDLVQLNESIQEIHPSPFLYITDSVYYQSYKKALSAASTEKTVLEFAQIVADFVHGIKDSHTNFNPRDLLFQANRKKTVVPFYLKEINGKYFLDKIYLESLPIGCEILQVNEFKTDSLYQLSKRFCFREGDAFLPQTEIASKMAGIVFNLFNTAPIITFKYVSFKGDTLSKICPALTVKKMMRMKNWYDSEELTYYFDKNNVAVLTVKSFETGNLSKYKKQVDFFFSEVERKKCKNVVIDLRDNRGGLILAQEYLISYLNKAKVNQQMTYLYKRSKFDRFSLLPFYQRWQFQKKARLVYPRGIISKEYDFFQSPLGTVKTILYDYLPKNQMNKVYEGECTLVINGFSMSASALFASWFRDNQRGKIIGSPCMGPMSGTFGNSATIRLKNSQFPIMISTLKFTPTKYEKIQLEPIQPDVLIQKNVNDLIQKSDPILNYLGVIQP